MYVASINLVQQLSVDELLKRLDQVSVLNPSVSQTLVQEMLANDPESDIATTNMKVSLLCPVSRSSLCFPFSFYQKSCGEEISLAKEQ